VSPPSAVSPIGGKIYGVEIPLPHSKVTWPTPKCISIRRTQTVDLRCVNISRIISGVSGPKFTNFFCSMLEEYCLITQFTICQYLYPFQRYSWSKSKVVVKSTKFWSFFALPNFKGAVPPKVVPGLSPTPSGMSRGKVS